jgi:hypothetical protein
LRFRGKISQVGNPGFPADQLASSGPLTTVWNNWTSAYFLSNLQQFGIQNTSEERESAEFLRNLQQFGIQNVSEEWKSADFFHNLQQFGTKNPRNGNNSFTVNVNFFFKI